MRRSILLALISAAVILSLSRGIRNTFGLFLSPMTLDLGIGREAFSTSIAIQSVVLGLAQPLAGIAADKYGAARVLVAGGAIYALGLIVMAGAESSWGLHIGAGLLVGIGGAAANYSVALGAIGRRVASSKRSMALGLASAGGSVGQFVLPPASLWLIEIQGWSGALIGIALLAAALMIPAAAALRGRASDAPVATAGTLSLTLSQAVGEALRHKGYWFLTMGFFVCGFQVTFIAVHLPPYLTDIGLTASIGATALALIGFFNIIGTFAFGYLGDRLSKKYLLSSLYFSRALAVMFFLLFPKTDISVMIFASVMGALWLATIPLTSGLVAHIFGARYMATLFAIVYFSHQIGSFLGVWLGGYLFDATGSYDGVWIVTIILGFVAAALHLPIAEKPLRTQAA
ncbi:MAG TPA: MFS transporter [Rhodospirillales bacterium]|jgi:predicted MFS family arabinose efflux permease|nr:MFS transporter [Rhodospirillales bacterium]